MCVLEKRKSGHRVSALCVRRAGRRGHVNCHLCLRERQEKGSLSKTRALYGDPVVLSVLNSEQKEGLGRPWGRKRRECGRSLERG